MSLPWTMLRAAAQQVASGIGADDLDDDLLAAADDLLEPEPRPDSALDQIVLWILMNPKDFIMGCAAVLVPLFMLAAFAAVLMIRQIDSEARDKLEDEQNARADTAKGSLKTKQTGKILGPIKPQPATASGSPSGVRNRKR